MRSRSPSHRHRRRSRSTSRNRDRSLDRDFRHYRSRSRSPRRYRSRSWSRGRSRSRSRERYYSPDRPRHEAYNSGYEPRPHAWGPGAGDLESAPPGGWNASAYAGPGWHGGMRREQLPPWSDQGRPGGDWQEQGVHDWGRDRSRSRGSGLSRGSDTDKDWDWDREVEWARRFKGPEVATASVFIKGLPEDADESVVHQLFAAYPNIQSVKVLRDRATGASRGMAFLDFVAVDDARLLMESEYRWNIVTNGRRLLLDYSHGPPGSRGAGPAADTAGQQQDWICDMCNAVSFARRLECYHCSTARPANPRRVTADLNEPSNILKVSGLEMSTSEPDLFQFLAAVVPNILDTRVIRDKYTGAPRGFAFVELASIADAGKLMVACQGQTLPGQSTPLKICYAKAKEQMLGLAGQGDGGERVLPGTAAAGAPAGASAAASSASALSGWKPKEFSTAALQADSSDNAHDQAPAETAIPQQAAAEAAAGSTAASASNGAAGPGPSSEAAAASAAAAQAAGVDAATIQAMTQAGFEFQASSGYWYDAKTGYFYDAKTSLYYHHSTQQWYQYDHSTGQYNVVSGEQQQQQQQMQQAPQQQQQQQQQRPAADKRRRAVIGSAAQYNPEGLLAAAALAKEREDEQKRIAAAKAARDRQQQQQNKHDKKQPLMPGKPGIGALPGTGAAPAAAAAQVVSNGPVQGVVYKSKWAQRAAQQQR